jgi:hypothetical protein
MNEWSADKCPEKLTSKYTKVQKNIQRIHKLQVQVLCVMMLCSDVIGYQCFRRPCCLHLQRETCGMELDIDIGQGVHEEGRVLSRPTGSREG